MQTAIKPQHFLTALILAALTIGVFSCGQGGRDRRGGIDLDFMKAYDPDPQALRNRLKKPYRN